MMIFAAAAAAAVANLTTPVFPVGFVSNVMVQHSTRTSSLLARWTLSVELQFERWLAVVDGHVLEQVYDFGENTEFTLVYDDAGPASATQSPPRCSTRPIDASVSPLANVRNSGVPGATDALMSRFVPAFARLELVSREQTVDVNFVACRHWSVEAKSTTIDYYETADALRLPRRLTLRSRFGAGYWTSFTFLDFVPTRPRLTELRLPPAVRALCVAEGAHPDEPSGADVDDVQERIRLFEQRDAADSVERRQRLEREQWLARIRANHERAAHDKDHELQL